MKRFILALSLLVVPALAGADEMWRWTDGDGTIHYSNVEGLAVGAATAVTGSIGFVGLVVPHVLRPLVGNAPGRLLAASALGGGVLVLAADIAVRFLSPQGDLRLGVVTALIGAPFFLWLVVRLRRELSP